MTGRPDPDLAGSSGSAGVQTLSERQSSSWGSDPPGSAVLVGPGIERGCGAIGPNAEASRTPTQGSAACGGSQRRGPVGAWA